ncbi:MAG: amino acid ABC transporter permease [Ardenticatenaceae bacterium]
MAPIDGKSSDPTSILKRVTSFLFDVRFLGVLGQVGFVIAVFLGFQFLAGNLVTNLSAYSSQFICSAAEGVTVGTNETAFKCAFDFMDNEAGFDISDTLVPFVNTDSYWWAFYVGLVNLFRVGVLGVVLTTIVGIVAGVARLSNNWLLSRIALGYVELIRNTPLLIQLFLIYFGVLQVLPDVKNSISVAGLPILLSNRGISMPWGRSTSVTALWIILVIVAYLISQLVGEYFNRREFETKKEQNPFLWSLCAFIFLVYGGWFLVPLLKGSLAFLSIGSVVLAIFLLLAVVEGGLMWWLLGKQELRTGINVNRYGWPIFLALTIAITGFAMSSSVSDPAVLVAEELSGVSSIQDVPALAIANAGVSTLDEVNALGEEALDEAAVTVCVIGDSSQEALAINQFVGRSVPYDLVRSKTVKQMSRKFGKNCQVVMASQAQASEMLDELDNSAGVGVTQSVVDEVPLNWTVPAREKLNIRGGIKLTPEFAAILLGLVIFYGGSLAEVVRAGIQSVSKGQTEAALALGLSEGQRLRLIILPQALKVIIPPTIGIYLSLIKDTSLGGTVGFQEMYSVTNTTINQSGRSAQLVLLMMIVYLTISLIFSGILNWYNSRITLVER